MNICLIGKKSLIAKTLFIFLKKKNSNVRLIDFNQLPKKIKFSTIINCSSKKNDPKLKNIDWDRDVKIAKIISKQKKSCHFIMISTAKVYGGKKIIKEECNICKPLNSYGKHRLNVEEKIKKILSKNYTILRLSNLANFDIRPNSFSKTFINKMLTDLKNNGIIEIPVKKNIKDFIDEKSFCKIIVSVANKKIFGTYNLSSGIETRVDILAKCIISGFGSGKIIRNSNLITDNFVLKSKKLFKKINFSINSKYLIKEFKKLGKKLKYE
jgi:dTDP-4-dehydrorhamnose reductase